MYHKASPKGRAFMNSVFKYKREANASLQFVDKVGLKIMLRHFAKSRF